MILNRKFEFLLIILAITVGNVKCGFFGLFTWFTSVIQRDSDVFSINQNLKSLHQGEHRFSHAFFTKVLNFRDNRVNVQF